MQEIKSIEIYREIKVGFFKRKVRIKKLTIKQNIEFVMLYNIFLMKQSKPVIDDLVKLLTGRIPILLSKSAKKHIITEGRGFNSQKNKSKKSDERNNENWLQGLIAYFGREFGWNKHNVLNLYPDEVDIIIAQNESFKANDLLLQTGVYHTPSNILKYIENMQKGNMQIVEKLDRASVDGLKKQLRCSS